MPGILSKFRRSPSASSSISSDSRKRRASTASSHTPISFEDSEVVVSPNRSPGRGQAGSAFVEDFGADDRGSNSTPSRLKHKPPPLAVPTSGQKGQVIGTPKLVLTEDGSSSPISVSGSPALSGRRQVIGLGLGEVATSDSDLPTPTGPAVRASPPKVTMSLPVVDPTTRQRSGSIISNRNSIPATTSPATSPLLPVDSRRSSASKKSKKRDRRRSINSAISAHGGIAAALAKGGLHIATPVGDDLIRSGQQQQRKQQKSANKRSPFLTRRDQDDDYDRDEDGAVGEYSDHDEESDDLEDESDSDLGDDLPVTGFAVASNRRNADFHAQFPTVDEGDYLIEDYGCALAKEILVQGRLYVSENHLCFHANIFGWVTDVVIAFSDIRTIEKKMTALVIPNAIGVSTANARYTFASFISRDTTFDVLMNIWRLCNPNAVMSSVSLSGFTNNGSRAGSVTGVETDLTPGVAAGAPGHAPTQCACGKAGKHYPETALDTVFHSTPEKVYNLMFNSEWFKNFLSDNQKLRDIETSDWRPITPGESKLMRSTSYIKPLNGSIGPKQTKCHITDEYDHFDLDDYISLITTTRTSDVPSGGVFSVKTRTCLMWAGSNSTKVVVSTTVEWTGKSWVKGIIEKSAIDGQKQYHDDLETGMRAYMKEHASEFAGEGGADEVEDQVQETSAAQDVSPTEAQAYAAKNRRERQDQDLSALQGGLDSVISGVKAIASGTKNVLASIVDLVGGVPLRTETLMGFIIVVLVVSNIWTYLSMDSNSTTSIERRARRRGVSQDDVSEALRLLLQQSKADSLPTAVEEARELLRIIDEVESRAGRIRRNVLQTQSERSGLSDLD